MILDRIMPLLSKELTEQASRPRTYILRVAGALVLYGLVALVFAEQLLVIDPLNQIGSGGELVNFVVGVLFAVIHLALPAALAGSIAGELQRGTLPLLRLAGMSPRTILLQKLLSAGSVLFTWTLLVLPLLAVAYAKGGVDLARLPTGLWCLFWSTLQVGALALWTSAAVGDPSRALMQVYVRMLVWYVGLLPVLSIGLAILAAIVASAAGDDGAAAIGAGFFPPLVWFTTERESWVWAVVGPIPSVLTVIFFLWQAQVSLERATRAARIEDPDAVLRRAARQDRSTKPLTDGSGSRATSTRDPYRQPVAWMEQGRLLSTFGSLNLSVVLTVGVFALVLATFGADLRRGEALAATYVAVLFWCTLAMGLVMSVAAAVTADRSAGTHELLLTTTLKGRTIIAQKLSVARRLLLIFGGALGYVWFLEAVRERGGEVHPLIWFLIAIGHLVAYGTALAWGSALISLTIRRRLKAVGIICGTLVLWCALPLWIGRAIEATAGPSLLVGLLIYLSPAAALQDIEFATTADSDWYVWQIGNLAVWTVIAVVLRFVVLARADELLGRLPDPKQ